MNAINIRSWSDLRAFAYVALPVLMTFLVGQGYLNDNQAAQWSGLALAVLGPVLAAVMAKSVSTARTALYALAAAAQAIIVGYGLVTDDQIGVWMPIVNLVIGGVAGGVAAANTNTKPW